MYYIISLYRDDEMKQRRCNPGSQKRSENLEPFHNYTSKCCFLLVPRPSTWYTETEAFLFLLITQLVPRKIFHWHILPGPVPQDAHRAASGFFKGQAPTLYRCQSISFPPLPVFSPLFPSSPLFGYLSLHNTYKRGKVRTEKENKAKINHFEVLEDE